MEKLAQKEESLFKYRKGEITPAVFSGLDGYKQSNYVFKILLIPIEERSTYENVILSQYKRYVQQSGNKVPVQVEEEIISTEDVHICAPISNIEIPTVEELVESGEEYVREYLNLFFEIEYSDWETNVRFHDVDKFISNTKNFMHIDELTDVHIRAYKLIKTSN
jgi:hypothetical protein